jgi:hypothetical protein
MVKSDATLFECVALLTLQKKRTINATFDKVVYLGHKQRVYQSISKTLIDDSSNVSAATALTMTLLSFVEVQEGNFRNALAHINAVAAMDFVRRLDEVQWRLIIWNDLRYAMKLMTLPTLCYYIPIFLTSAMATIDGAVVAEARRLALGNLKHLRRFPGLDEYAWYSLLVSLHTISSLASLEGSVHHDTRLVYAYEAEYRAHTLAAKLSKTPGPNRSASIMILLIIACQLHILAATSSFAPSSVECRDVLLNRAQSILVSLDTEQNVHVLRSQAVPMLWALSTFTAHVIDGGFKGRPFFTKRLAAEVELKRLHSKATYVQILKAWPWIDHWHQSRIAAAWEDVLVGRGRRWRCIASTDTTGKVTRRESGKFYAGVYCSMNLDLSIRAFSPSHKVDAGRRDHDDRQEQAGVDSTVPQGFQCKSLEHSLQVFRLVQMRKRLARHWLSQKRTERLPP